MADQKTTLDMLQDLDADLVRMADSFSKLVRASKVQTEGPGAGNNHVPGDLFGVLVEKLVHRSEVALRKVGELRKQMTLHNVSDSLAKVKRCAGRLEQFRMQVDSATLSTKGGSAMRLKHLLMQLEKHYYSSGYLVEDESAESRPDSELEELCLQALNAPFEVH